MPASAKTLAVALLIWGGAVDEPPAPGSTGSARPGRDRLLISVRPRLVYRGGKVLLSATILRREEGPPRQEAPPAGAWRFQWRASGGLLLADDLAEVEWRAPPEPGEWLVSVEAASPDARLKEEITVRVEAPSTEGMAFVPAGTFLRGDVRGTRNVKELKTVQNASEEPAHIVYLDGYWVDRQPVTHWQYKRFLEEALAQGMVRVEDIAVMGALDGAWVPYYYFQSFERLIARFYESRNARKPEFHHWISHDGSAFHVRPGREKYPAVDVTWFGAAAYARFYGKSLPSEAQWEKAARGTDGRSYPWGNQWPTAYHVDLNLRSGKELTPVGRFSPTGDSPYGVADMLSGYFEWTNDWFNANYYGDYQGESPWRNPRGPFWGRSHAIRGSPLSLQFPQAVIDTSEPVSFRYSWRFEFLMGDSFANRETGFRTVIEAPPSQK